MIQLKFKRKVKQRKDDRLSFLNSQMKSHLFFFSFFEENQLNEKTTIEHFPIELWWEIFRYFDGQSLLKSFFNLNHLINSRLRNEYLSIYWIWNLNEEKNFFLKYFHFNQIHYLTMNFEKIEKEILFHFDQFEQLHSLNLININKKQIISLSQTLKRSLQCLSIQSEFVKNLFEILSIYFPNVYQMKLKLIEKHFQIRIPKNFHQIHSNSSQIQSLTLFGRIKLAKLFSLWPIVNFLRKEKENIPSLRSFYLFDDGIHQCDYWIDENRILKQNFPLNFIRLHINIYDDDLSFINLERIIPSTLRYLSISGSIADDDLQDYLSSNNWIRLIERSNYPKLFRIHLNLSSYFDPSDFSGLKRTLNQFRKNFFFRHLQIRSQQFLIEIHGFIHMSI